MKTLGRCEFENLKVGEVFAEYDEGYWNILIKVKTRYNAVAGFIIADTADEWIGKHIFMFAELHKLSLSTQRNWIEWR